MTNEEFSNAFDTLLNSFKHKSEFGNQSSLADVTIDEYEKSIFLTQAQDNIVKSYFTRSLNPNGEGFDDSTRRQTDFSTLITVKSIDISSATKTGGFSDNGYTVSFKDSDFTIGSTLAYPLFIINERVTTKEVNTPADGDTPAVYKPVSSYVIVPLNYKEYDRMMSRAYSEPLKRQAWRLFESSSSDLSRQAEIILRTDVKSPDKYIIRYVRRPIPIVLIDLTDTNNRLTIDGVTTVTQCELNPTVHQEILQEAVRLALASNGIETRDQRAAREAAQG